MGRTLRCHGQLQGAAVTGAVVTVVLVVVGVVLPTTIPKALVFLAAACLAALTVRAVLAGVRVERDRIVIRGLLETTSVPWTQLEGFSFGALGSFPAVGIARLRDGRELAMTAISTGRAGSPQARIEAEAVVAELNRLHDRLG